jgi:hypothetical protein
MLKKKNTSGFKKSVLLIISLSFLFFLGCKSLLHEDILPLLLTTKDHLKPKRKCGTFAEDFTAKASRGELVTKGKDTFSFIYTKSNRNGHAFAGVWFPLEDLNIDFSDYDYLTIHILTNKARRIPVNLSVQNRVQTHQYIRQFIEVKEGQTIYELALKDFYTPSEWYTTNNISQAQIPKQDFSQVEAISFESCHLLKKGIRDEFIIESIVLKKDLTSLFFVVVIFDILAVLVLSLKFQNNRKVED